MTLRWMRTWLERLKLWRAWPVHRPGRPASALRLRVESLEQRTLPSAVLFVTNTRDSGAGSLRYEIQAAHDGATIKFSSALNGKTIVLSSGKEILINTDISIVGPGSGRLTIEGHGSRLFEIAPGATVALDGLALEYGHAAGQGGAILDRGALTLKNDVLKYNVAKGSAGVAAQGGAVYVDSAAALTLDNDVVRLNKAQGSGSAGQGGALFFASGSSGTLSGDTVKSNIASGYATLAAQGGGVWAQGANLNINLSTFAGNTATGDASGIGLPGAAQGGGLYLDGGTLALTQSTVSGNLASGTPGGSGAPGITGTPGGAGGIAQGGGLFATDSTPANITLTGDTFAANVAYGGDGGWGGTGTKFGGTGGTGGDGTGGGIALHDTGGGNLTIALTNDTFASNVAKAGVGGTGGTGPRGQGGAGGTGGNGQGGAIWADGGTITLRNDTIAGSSPAVAHSPTVGNKAVGQSGGYASAGRGALGPGGSGQGGGLFTTGNAAMTVINTIVANNIASSSDPDVSGTFTGGDHNLVGDPTGSTGFGGSDLTGVDPQLASLGHYGGPTQTMLPIGGPAVDAADDGAAPATDQRGIARPQGAHADIGAVEAVNLAFALAGGNNQTVRRGMTFNPLIVKLTENGKPVAGIVVQFSIAPGAGPLPAGGKLNRSQATTNANGRAAVVVTANSKPGPFSVLAEIDGLPPLTFHLTNR